MGKKIFAALLALGSVGFVYALIYGLLMDKDFLGYIFISIITTVLFIVFFIKWYEAINDKDNI